MTAAGKAFEEYFKRYTNELYINDRKEYFHTMMMEHRNFIRNGFNEGWNAALAWQGEQEKNKNCLNCKGYFVEKQYCSKTASPMNEIAAKEYVCNRYEAREKL